MIKISKGLNLPITGEPAAAIEDVSVKTVALVGDDYVGMKPTMHVKVGDSVKAGQLVFEDKKNPGVRFTAPANGTVTAVNRGERRVLQSVVIAVTGNDKVSFTAHGEGELLNLGYDKVQEQLNESGLWTALRTRPFSKAPALGSKPNSIFVTTMDTNPLAADVKVAMQGQETAFNAGLKVLTNLTEGKVYVCKKHGHNVSAPAHERIVCKSFDGPHPAGNAGTHIHFLDAVGAEKTVWTVNYQDVIAIGKLFVSGELDLTRVISFAGPQAKNPKHLRVNLGASIDELKVGRIKDAEVRAISGSVLSGRKAAGPFAFLGRFHTQVSVLEEGRKREFLGWQKPGLNKFSVKNTFASSWLPGYLKRKFAFTTDTGGSIRAIVPIGSYEKVMPLDIEPTFLLRSLLSNDTDLAQNLGALELDEEDLGLLTFVCPTKEEYAPRLRSILTTIEREG